MKDGPLITYDIDGTTVFKVIAKNRLDLPDALKDGRKWKKDLCTEWSGFVSVRYRDIVRNTVTKDSSTTSQAIQATSITADLWLRNNWQEIERNVKKVGNVKALSNEKVKQKKVLHAA